MAVRLLGDPEALAAGREDRPAGGAADVRVAGRAAVDRLVGAVREAGQVARGHVGGRREVGRDVHVALRHVRRGRDEDRLAHPLALVAGRAVGAGHPVGAGERPAEALHRVADVTGVAAVGAVGRDDLAHLGLVARQELVALHVALRRQTTVGGEGAVAPHAGAVGRAHAVVLVGAVACDAEDAGEGEDGDAEAGKDAARGHDRSPWLRDRKPGSN